MKTFSLHSSIICSLFLIASCHSPVESVFKKINTSDKGDFRSVSIRSSREEVAARESISPKNAESDYLFYEIPLENKDEYYTLGYSFNEKGLYEILLDVYLGNPEDALQLFQEIKEKFSSRFGNPQQEDGTTIVWTFKSENSEEVEVTLSDETDTDLSGKISVSFYDLAY